MAETALPAHGCHGKNKQGKTDDVSTFRGPVKWGVPSSLGGPILLGWVCHVAAMTSLALSCLCLLKPYPFLILPRQKPLYGSSGFGMRKHKGAVLPARLGASSRNLRPCPALACVSRCVWVRQFGQLRSGSQISRFPAFLRRSMPAPFWLRCPVSHCSLTVRCRCGGADFSRVRARRMPAKSANSSRVRA